MTRREIFWQNFRIMRKRGRAMSRHEREATYWALRTGPMGIGLCFAAAAIISTNAAGAEHAR